jgi:hypothetical protein
MNFINSKFHEIRDAVITYHVDEHPLIPNLQKEATKAPQAVHHVRTQAVMGAVALVVVAAAFIAVFPSIAYKDIDWTKEAINTAFLLEEAGEFISASVSAGFEAIAHQFR